MSPPNAPLTPRDEKVDLSFALGRMEGKVDLLLLHFDEVKDRVEGHDARLNALERALAQAQGYAYAGSAVIALAIPIALKYFGLA